MRRLLPLLSALSIAGSAFTVSAEPCQLQSPPEITAVPVISTGLPYRLSWFSDIEEAAMYTLEESRSESPATMTYLPSFAQWEDVAAQPDAETYNYRVRIVCNQVPGSFSRPASVRIVPRPQDSILLYAERATVAEDFDLDIPGFGAAATGADAARVTVDVPTPGFSFFPAFAVALPPGGATVRVVVWLGDLPAGRTRANLILERFQGGQLVTRSRVPVDVTVVQPVGLGSRAPGAPLNGLLFPAIANASGRNSFFRSDVRLLNAGPEDVTAELAFTPTGSTGTAPNSVKRLRMKVPARSTAALDDVVFETFGMGPLQQGIGSLEVRPLNGKLLGSSRTYSVRPDGTLGQFVPAYQADSFVAAGEGAISLQHLSANDRYRTNVGFVEGSGTEVAINVRLLDAAGTEIASRSLALQPFEVRQLPIDHETLFPGARFDNARIEVSVTSPAGTASAYASVVDELSSDPYFVAAVRSGQVRANRYTLPGVAAINTGRNFHSDVRIFNAGDTPEEVTLSFAPFAGPSPAAPVTRTIGAGEVLVIDDALSSLWNLDGAAGSVIATTPSESSLVMTGRTFSRKSDGGTMGQLIDGMTTVADGIAAGDEPLQVLQLEQSENFRSNLGIVELTGEHGVTVELKAYSSHGTYLNVRHVAIAPGQSLQITKVFEYLEIPVVYNGRVSVEVISGNGRVMAYGSVIDNRTEDPTYVAAQ